MNDDDLEVAIHEAFYDHSERSAELKHSPPAPDDRGWGVPDWRNESDYPNSENLTPEEWRWEFLRRNHGYRHDFLLPDKEIPYSAKGLYFERIYKMQWVSDPRMWAGNLGTWFSEEEIERCFEFFKPDYIQDFVRFLDLYHKTTYAFFYEFDKLLKDPNAGSSLFMRVDMRKPLKPQFERLYEIATDCQKSWKVQNRRMLPKHWSKHLRILDARDAGLSYKQIAGELFKIDNPTAQDARDAIQSAEALRRSWPY